MRTADIDRLIALKGQSVTLRRLTGTARVPFDVPMMAVVEIGAAQIVVGDVTQTADRIIFTSTALESSGWRGSPRHGDEVVYADGRTVHIQGRPESHLVEGSSYAFIAHTLGG